jgi:phosphoesterase RecJ-like protein
VIDTVASILQGAHSFYIATHLSPDGDAIGSTLGLYWALTSTAKQCTLACNDAVPSSLRFIPGAAKFVVEPPAGQDVIVVLDTGDVSRLGTIYRRGAFDGRTVINIDHHLSNTRFGTINWVDPQASSVGEMVFGLVRLLGVAPDRAIATSLLTALVTDTMGFRTASTSAATLRVAAELVEAGAPLAEIVQQAFESRPLPVLRVWGWVLDRFTIADGVAWAAIPASVMSAHGVSEDDTRGLVNILRGARGVSVAALLMESGDGRVKTEFRSNGTVNVAEIAMSLGGGGHRAASGCTLAGPLGGAEQRVLAEIRKHM